MHQPQDAAHLPFFGEDREKDGPVLLVVLERPVYQPQPALDQILQFRGQVEPAFLHDLEDLHHARGIPVEDVSRFGEELPFADHEFFFNFPRPPEQLCEQVYFHPPLFADPSQRKRGDEVDTPRMPVIVAHEGLAAAEDVFLWVLECGGDFSLELEGQLLRGPPSLVVHLCSHPEQEVMCLFQRTPFLFPQDFLLHEPLHAVGT